MRIGIFVGSFPVLSETFIVRQITGLIDLGQQVDIYADTPADPASPVHAEVGKYRLLDRTTFMDVSPETAPWEMPVWPIFGRTWPPGSATSLWNVGRLARALPRLIRCLARAPRLTWQALRRSEYGYQAASLSVLYRLSVLSARRGGYDVLHAHFGPVGNSFRFARALWRAPLMVSFHGYDFSTLPRRQGGGMYARLFATADLITVNSDYTRSRIERLGCPQEKIRKLPVGLDPEGFPFRERTRGEAEPLRIVTVGRLVEIKGHEFCLRALVRLRETVPEVHYDIVGDGPLRPQLEKLASDLGLAEQVTFHGALDGDGVKEILNAAHIFLLASVNVEGDEEGQGLVLQEAQASGLPVIVTRHGAFPEGILPGESGILVPERDADALAESLFQLGRHPELWPRMGRAGRDFVLAHYDSRQLNRRLTGLYAEALEAYRGGSR